MSKLNLELEQLMKPYEMYILIIYNINNCQMQKIPTEEKQQTGKKQTPHRVRPLTISRLCDKKRKTQFLGFQKTSFEENDNLGCQSFGLKIVSQKNIWLRNIRWLKI